jgi:hypothetical protein
MKLQANATEAYRVVAIAFRQDEASSQTAGKRTILPRRDMCDRDKELSKHQVAVIMGTRSGSNGFMLQYSSVRTSDRLQHLAPQTPSKDPPFLAESDSKQSCVRRPGSVWSTG